MPVESLREQIVARVFSRISSITSGGTYFFTPEVARDWKSFEDIRRSPSYGIVEGTETSPSKTFTHVKSALKIMIVGWLKSTSLARRTELNRAIADVRRAVYTDESWGGLALVTHLREVRVDDAPVVGQPFGFFEIELEIEYMHLRTVA